MCWTDRCSIQTIKDIRDFYKITDFVETGTFMGINAEVHAKNFKNVYTVENNEEYFHKAYARLKKHKNVHMLLGDSTELLKGNYQGIPLYYLDAHFYRKEGPRWQVQRELKAMQGKEKVKPGVIVIHDFSNGLGCCIYDGERLGMNVVKGLLKKLNPNFYFYTNNMDFVDIMKPSETKDPIMKDNLEYAWKTPRLTYRGILYCVPTKLPDYIKLVRWT